MPCCSMINYTQGSYITTYLPMLLIYWPAEEKTPTRVLERDEARKIWIFFLFPYGNMDMKYDLSKLFDNLEVRTQRPSSNYGAVFN